MKTSPTLRKTFNLIQIVLLLTALFLIITSTYGEYAQYEYKWIKVYGEGLVKVVDEAEYVHAIPLATGTLHFSNLLHGNPLWGYLTLGIIGLSIIISLASIIRKSNDRDSILHFFLPVLAVPVYAFFSAMTLDYADCLDRELFTVVTGSNPLKNVTIILCVVIVIAFMKRSKLFNPKPIAAVDVAPHAIIPSNTEELKKYKDLLDSGVISQEEFDAKKKQILDL